MKIILIFLSLFYQDIQAAMPLLKPNARQVVTPGLNTSGLPIPRFACLRHKEVNVYVGPGDDYHIVWKLYCQYMPVEITAEFYIWRRIRDSQGTTGWVRKTSLMGKRTVIIKDANIVPLHKNPDSSSATLLRLEPNVIADVLEVKDGWCRLKIDRVEGWVLIKNVWGVYPTETKLK